MDVDDELLPKQSRFDWWYVAVGGVVMQIAIGLPMWYTVYVRGYTRDELAAAIIDTTTAVPGGELVTLAALVALTAGIIGSALGLWLHHNELERGGAELGLRWRFITVLCIQFWPLSVVTALKHYRTRQRIHD